MKVGWLVIGWLIVGLSVVAAFEAADALRLIEPDAGDGSGPFRFLAWPISPLLTMLLGGAVLMVGSLSARVSDALTVPILPLVALAAGAVAALDLVRYDPYALPTLIRVIDVMDVSPAWFAVIGVLAASGAFVARLRPRLGLFVTGAFLWFCFGALFAFGPWH
jgi:hypothetical protein